MTNTVIDFDWIKTQSAQEFVDSLLHHNKRRQFGLLEQPSLPPNKALSSVKYKIFVCGKSGIGKTTLISQLAGWKTIESGSENAGIATTVIHWPVRLTSTGQNMFFQLHFWDVAENTLKKFNHIMPACKAEVDCIIYTFSLIDRSSFLEIPSLLNQDDDSNKNPVQVIVPTKSDQYAFSDISQKEINELSKTRNVPVLRLKCLFKSSSVGRETIFEVSSFLNNLSALLFQRDLILAKKS